MPCGWEGNRRSGVAVAMRHRLQWFIHPRAHGLDREMSTPPTLLTGHGTPLPFCGDEGRIEAAEMRVYRQILRVPFTAKKTNEWVLEKAGAKKSFLADVKQGRNASCEKVVTCPKDCQ